MQLIDHLKEIVTELDKTLSGKISWQEEMGFPDFTTARNGIQYNFTKKAKEAIASFTEIVMQNRDKKLPKIEKDEYAKIVKQAIVETHSIGGFESFSSSPERKILSELKDEIENHISSISQSYTHYFPAWTIGAERISTLELGPVKFTERLNWIESVDFPEKIKERFTKNHAEGISWKDPLTKSFTAPHESPQLCFLASTIYDAIKDCPSVLGVTIFGYEQNFSRKLARLACKTALDAISLAIGQQALFHQQALQEERLPPIGSSTIMESNGFLYMPGNSIGPRIPIITPKRAADILAEKTTKKALSAFSRIIDGIVNPNNHSHPKLANRWATALDWFAEGARESNDAIALTKIGTCLDVLSCGGKYTGIARMAANLINIKEDDEFIKAPKAYTLNDLVKEIYDNGRSKILHGTYFDRLESFRLQRNYAYELARIVLIISALRLENYSGNDTDKAFINMTS